MRAGQIAGRDASRMFTRDNVETLTMEDLFISRRLTIPASEIDTTFARSSGPGGQNVNKVNSKVTLRWKIRDNPQMPEGWRERTIVRYGNRINNEGQLVIHSQRYRAQPQNLEDCRQKLRELLLDCQLPPTKRLKTRPTLGSKKRRLEQKSRQGEKKRLRGRVKFD
jgi:ribosome-associated protein